MSNKLHVFKFMYDELLTRGKFSRDALIRRLPKSFDKSNLSRYIRELNALLGVKATLDNGEYVIRDADKNKLLRALEKKAAPESENEARKNAALAQFAQHNALFWNNEGETFSDAMENYKRVIHAARHPRFKDIGNAAYEKILQFTLAMTPIEFNYYTYRKENVLTLQAIPYMFYFYNEKWFLVARSLTKDRVQKYALNKITNAHQLAFGKTTSPFATEEEREKVIRHAQTQGGVFYLMKRKKVKTIVRVKEKAAWQFVQNDFGFGQKTLGHNADGSIDVQFHFQGFIDMWALLRKYIEHVTIVSPKSLKKRLVDHLSQALASAKEEIPAP